MVRVLRSTAAGTLHSLTSVIFPADCRVCGLPLFSFSRLPVCPSCWDQLPSQAGALCARCGEALYFELNADEALCRPCRTVAPPFQKAVAHGIYAGALRSLVHLLKYDGMEPLARRLGELAADQALAIPGLSANLVVVPVPLWNAKRRQRGFNQAESLARGMVAAMRRRRPEMHLRVEAGALARQRATESQAGLSPHERRVNVRGAFFVPHPAAVNGRNVLLIDDIYTTGATARACAQALRAAGASNVWVVTVARAQREDAPQHAHEFAESTRPVEPSLSPAIPMDQDVAFWEPGR